MPLANFRNVNGVNIAEPLKKNVIDVPLSKVYFEYSNRWWDGMDVSGRCFSSLSVFRKIYFPNDGCFLFAYCDGKSALKLKDLFESGENFLEIFSKTLLDALPIGHKNTVVQDPIQFGLQFWESGVSLFKKTTKLSKKNFLKIDNNFYYCSDLCTTFSGWVEGAIASSEAVTTEIISQENKTYNTSYANKVEAMPIYASHDAFL